MSGEVADPSAWPGDFAVHLLDVGDRAARPARARGSAIRDKAGRNSVGSDSIPDEIIVVHLEGSQAPDSPTEPTRGPGLKVAVISGTEKKVIGLQG